MIDPHLQRSRERVAAHPVVLLVQDPSEIDLPRPQHPVAGAGNLDGSRRGFLLHEMPAFTPEGIPLGTVWAEMVNRTEGVSQASPAEKREERKHLPMEAKESMRWRTGLRQARELAQQAPATQCIGVGDSRIHRMRKMVWERSPAPLAAPYAPRPRGGAGIPNLNGVIIGPAFVVRASGLHDFSMQAGSLHHKAKQAGSLLYERFVMRASGLHPFRLERIGRGNCCYETILRIL